MSDLAAWLLEQIDADEEVAGKASSGPWQYGDVESVAGGMLYDPTRTIASLVYEQSSDHDGSIVRHLLGPEADANGEHIARWDPARVLAECDAKRRIVEQYAPALDGDPNSVPLLTWILKLLALPYADRPGYREEWRP